MDLNSNGYLKYETGNKNYDIQVSKTCDELVSNFQKQLISSYAPEIDAKAYMDYWCSIFYPLTKDDDNNIRNRTFSFLKDDWDIDKVRSYFEIIFKGQEQKLLSSKETDMAMLIFVKGAVLSIDIVNQYVNKLEDNKWDLRKTFDLPELSAKEVEEIKLMITEASNSYDQLLRSLFKKRLIESVQIMQYQNEESFIQNEIRTISEFGIEPIEDSLDGLNQILPDSTIEECRLLSLLAKQLNTGNIHDVIHSPNPQKLILAPKVLGIKKYLEFLINQANKPLRKGVSTMQMDSDKEARGKKTVTTGFRWYGNEEQLELLFNSLKDVNAIPSDTDKKLFRNIFSKNAITENIEIVWQLKDVLLTYLFEELIKSSLLPQDTEYNSVIRNFRLFVKDDIERSTFENLKGIKQSYLNNKTGSPKNVDIIDSIINQVKKLGNR